MYNIPWWRGIYSARPPHQILVALELPTVFLFLFCFIISLDFIIMILFFIFIMLKGLKLYFYIKNKQLINKSIKLYLQMLITSHINL